MVRNFRDEFNRLNEQLLTIGYHDYQINELIKGIIGNNSIDLLDAQLQEDLLNALEEQLKFAEKCRFTKR